MHVKPLLYSGFLLKWIEVACPFESIIARLHCINVEEMLKTENVTEKVFAVSLENRKFRLFFANKQGLGILETSTKIQRVVCTQIFQTN